MALSTGLLAQAPPGDAPPRGGPGGLGGFGGMMQQEILLVEKFDKDGDKRLNIEERKAAREHLQKERAEGGGGRRGRGGPRGPGGPGFPGRGENQEPAKPGRKLSPTDVKSFPEAPLYDLDTLRTLFLEFENSDWEKELAEFKNTDVEVPARVTVDGKTYEDVGVHFRGMSSFGMIGEGRKRSMNLSMDFVHKDQQLGGYRTLNLLNSHEDPTFLRSVLYTQIARSYLPAPRANFVRVVIQGECWGTYINVQQVNKDFTKDWFGTTRGARWKVRGSPGGRASLAYIGEDVDQYKRLYTLKTKENPQVWADLIKLCKVLHETPADRLVEELSPLLDIDGALKFLALENALINNDGYWIRTSDYNLYQDEKGRFHVIPHDINETFLTPGGPGFGGGGGMGGGFSRGMFAQILMTQADKDGDDQLNKAELLAMADAWLVKLDSDKTGKLSKEQFAERMGDVIPAAEGIGPPGGVPPAGAPGAAPGGPRPPSSGTFFAPGLFAAMDADKDGSLTPMELKDALGKWAVEWNEDEGEPSQIDEEELANGLRSILPRSGVGGPGVARGPGGPPGPGGPGAGAAAIKGVELDPLLAANDPQKPLISKLLAIPSLRERYLGYTRDIAEKWLDWSKLGPIAERYHALIADDVQQDTRKLDSTEGFLKGLTENVQQSGGFGPGEKISLKNFADERRAYLLNYKEAKKAEAGR